MKTLALLTTAAFLILSFSACEEDEREHDRHVRDRGAATTTTTTEETTVRQASPSSTTTVRTY